MRIPLWEHGSLADRFQLSYSKKSKSRRIEESKNSFTIALSPLVWERGEKGASELGSLQETQEDKLREEV